MVERQEIDAALLAVREEWNRAERAIKIAEQVEGEIVNPAIYELRYGGRRLIEALDIIEDDKESALQRLHDAHFDCCRARHDAIDAATSKMAAMLNIAVERLGADVVLTHFTQFPKIVRRLADVRTKIATSRENRDDRDAIYASIEADDLGELMEIYSDFLASEGMMKASAKKQRREGAFNRFVGAVGIISLLLSTVFFFWE